MWNLLEELLAGVGWIGFGVLLRKQSSPLHALTMALGIACLVDSIATMLKIEAVSSVGLSVYLVLAPVWACWLGIRLLRSPLTIAESPWDDGDLLHQMGSGGVPA